MYFNNYDKFEVLIFLKYFKYLLISVTKKFRFENRIIFKVF